MSPTLEQAEVRLLGIPVATWQAASIHQEAIQREFDIIRPNLPREAVPQRLHDLIEGFSGRFDAAGDAATQELRGAVERGDESIDIVLTVPVAAGVAAGQLDSMLSEVDEFCRAGNDLLTLTTPPDLVRFRRWLLGEFGRQIDRGLDPMPWIEYAEPLDASIADAAGTTSERRREAVIVFEGDLDLSSAATLRSRIQDERASGAGHITLDMTAVRFMDSVGMSLLVSTHKRVAEDGTTMRLLLPERLRSLMTISGLIGVLEPEFPSDGEVQPES